MKIIVVGATGAIGRCVINEISDKHEIITAGRNSGDLRVDIEDQASVESMYREVGAFDALICASGKAHTGPLSDTTTEQLYFGLHNKLMGQVNLVMQGLKTINSNGSFTLTSGILFDEPSPGFTNAAMANGALNGFVRGAANELPNGVRINIVSPTLLDESVSTLGDYFKGYQTVAGKNVALAYVKSVENLFTGQIFKVGY